MCFFFFNLNEATRDLIDRVKLQSRIEPSTKWTQRIHYGPTATIKYQFRVVCDRDYYGPKCLDYCKPRNDSFGHFTCDKSGRKICMTGWTGQQCITGV